MNVRGPLGYQRTLLLDRVLEGMAQDLLAHDDRLRGFTVQVRFDGGVAHLDGELSTLEELQLLRELLLRHVPVFAVWDRVRVAGRKPIILDLGCGDTKQYPDNVGVDRRPGKAVNVLADLRRGLPFQDESVDQVFAVHVLEHLPDYIALLDEVHRVLRPGGVLHVMAPDWTHVNSVADPTHLRLFDVQTFKYLCSPQHTERCWYPLIVSSDGASVFADLVPVKAGQAAADALRMARFFD
ncbi:class I SAM-dependent methyltransferase [Carbonactinospora thermoautotrophica]|uniref:class I SAM-dependent methyltransferase n=1 Tax=Carbonactinospora thermoautotrophica TaxID=1469144 RepID=UPI00226FD7B3|nr:class I SAM-dependent methyltransferase [Carbonactinospora thermoautotrophica]